MSLSPKELTEQFNKLPADLRNVFFSSVTSEKIFELGKKYELSIDKIGNLGNEIGQILLGAKRAHELVANLQKSLDLPHEKAYLLAQDANHMIFFEIRESLKRLHGISQSEPLIPEAPLDGNRGLPNRPAAETNPIAPEQSPKPEGAAIPHGDYWKAVKGTTADSKTGGSAEEPGNMALGQETPKESAKGGAPDKTVTETEKAPEKAAVLPPENLPAGVEEAPLPMIIPKPEKSPNPLTAQEAKPGGENKRAEIAARASLLQNEIHQLLNGTGIEPLPKKPAAPVPPALSPKAASEPAKPAAHPEKIEAPAAPRDAVKAPETAAGLAENAGGRSRDPYRESIED